MQLVISGQRNMAPALAAKFCRLVNFSAPERSFFLALVRIEQAQTLKDRGEAEKAMRIAYRRLLTNPMSKAQEEIFRGWHHMLVRELVFLKDFEASGEYVSARLNGLITAAEGERSLALLKQAGFLVVGEEGRLKAAEPILDSGNNTFTHETMQAHHGETLVTWGLNLKKLDSKQQELGLLHIPIASEKIPELRKRIRAFQDEIIGWLESEKEPDRVVQLGTYLIPYSRGGEH